MQKSSLLFVQDPNIEKLISLLKDKKVLLMVEAGSSNIVGYPSWRDLLIKIKRHFLPEWPELTDNDNLLEYSHKLKEQITVVDDRNDEYYQFLEIIFKPKEGKNYTNFHKSLVKLGFCGIITTNYDKVLELAIGAAFSKDDDYFSCEAIDLCKPKTYRVFDFLRSLSSNNKCNTVLHLHGYYQNPENLVLTWKDYKEKYGDLDPKNDTVAKDSRPLDTLHRKVIWSLLTLHSLLFVGFSLQDDFFMDILRIVQQDFQLYSKPVHYAIMSYSSDEDKIKTIEILGPKGVTPIFYRKLKSIDDSDDHTGLQDLILEIERILEGTENIQSEYVKETEEKTERKNPITGSSCPTLEDMNRITGG